MMKLCLVAVLLAGCARSSPAPFAASSRTAGSARTFTEVGRTDWQPFSAWSLRRSDGPDIDVYVARRDEPRPTVLLLPGSKCFPLFWILSGRQISALFLEGAVPKVLNEVNVVVFDRRGLKSFGPPPKSREEAKASSVCTPERGGISKVERVDDASAVAAALLEQPWVSELWVVGHSAGGDVAAGVAKRLGDRVAAVGLFGAAGITRFFEKSTAARRRGGSLAAAAVFEELLLVTGPNPPAEIDGDPLVSVQTYSVDSTPLDDLRGLSVPVFVVHGDADDKVAIEAADAFVAELLRERTRSVRYAIFSGCDHDFFDAAGKDRSEDALRLFLSWAREPAKQRGVNVVTP